VGVVVGSTAAVCGVGRRWQWNIDASYGTLADCHDAHHSDLNALQGLEQSSHDFLQTYDSFWLLMMHVDSLYEAVGRGLAALRDADWAGDIGHAQKTITVVVKHPEVEHRVRMREFEAWLESNGRSPAEMV
jgi:hypothetical protein